MQKNLGGIIEYELGVNVNLATELQVTVKGKTRAEAETHLRDAAEQDDLVRQVLENTDSYLEGVEATGELHSQEMCVPKVELTFRGDYGPATLDEVAAMARAASYPYFTVDKSLRIYAVVYEEADAAKQKWSATDYVLRGRSVKHDELKD